MKVTVRWAIRAMNRREGDEETVELTPQVQTLINAGRIEVLEWHTPPAPAAPLDAAPEVSVPVGEPGSEGLTVPAAKPKPRRNPNLPIRK